jgi:hypothetical protein
LHQGLLWEQPTALWDFAAAAAAAVAAHTPLLQEAMLKELLQEALLLLLPLPLPLLLLLLQKQQTLPVLAPWVSCCCCTHPTGRVAWEGLSAAAATPAVHSLGLPARPPLLLQEQQQGCQTCTNGCSAK